MGFPKKVLESVLVHGTVFDPLFFSYFEETDLCHRIWLTGKTIQYAPKSVVYHKMGGTSTEMDNAFVQFHSYKNRITSYMKNFEWKNVWFLPLHIVFCMGIAFVLFIQGKFAYGWVIVRAIIWNIWNISDTLEKRTFIQLFIRRVPDSSYLPHVLVFPGLDYFVHLFRGTVGAEGKEWIK